MPPGQKEADDGKPINFFLQQENWLQDWETLIIY